MRRAATLFCGAGGSCLGMRQAGYEVIAGLDYDSSALATYTAAGGHPVQHMITEAAPVPPEWVAPLTGLDLLWASPPCQPWSRAGKRRGTDDERDAWPATIAAVGLLRPHWFIAENVRGVEKHLRAFVVPALESLGYVVSFRVLDAANYGLPQRRHRVILVAGPESFAWPHQTHGKRSLFVREGWKSMGEALGIEVRAIGQINPDTARGGNRWRESSDPDPTIPAIKSGITAEVKSGLLLNRLPSPTVRAGGSIDHTGKMGGGPTMEVYDPKHPPCNPDETASTIRSGGSGHSAPPVYVMAAGTAFDRPSPAVCASEAKGHTNPHFDRGRTTPINRASDANFLATGRRRLTTDECATLQGFPPDYPWQGGITSRYRQIGNAVPPLLARVLVERIP